MTDTKTQILDCAERLFAEHGVEGTSLRGILTQAGLNPASIHYHFGGKDALVEAVLARRLDPLNQERLGRFAELEAAAGDGPIAVEELVEAYVGPSLRLQGSPDFDGPGFLRFLGRFYAESGDSARSILERHFQPVVQRFAQLLRPSLPELDAEAFAWRVHFLVGAMAHTLSCRVPLHWLAPGAGEREVDEVIGELVAFVSAGLRGAPATSGIGTRTGDSR